MGPHLLAAAAASPVRVQKAAKTACCSVLDDWQSCSAIDSGVSDGPTKEGPCDLAQKRL